MHCYIGYKLNYEADTELFENKILKEVDCGLTAESGDFKTLAENVIAMYRKTEEERLQLGMNGQTYYKVHFQKKVCIDKLDQTMKI